MSTQVEEIRSQIDSLDDKIHDLLMKRAELVIRIGKAKRDNKIQFIQPDREALMLRRLLARHKGLLPKEAIVRIWRELVGAVSLLQTGLKVVVAVDPDDPLILWDMAKDYFSSVVPMKKVGDPLTALAAIRDGESTFAVMPWPKDDDKIPWWSYLMSDQNESPMRIMARLPFGDRVKSAAGPENKAMVVARVIFQPSGSDYSFLALELDPGVSRARIVETFKNLNMEPVSLYTNPGVSGEYSFHLVEFKDYIENSSDLFSKILTSLDSQNGQCVCLGGYPSPPIYDDCVGKGAEESAIESKKSA